VSKRYFFI